LRVSLTITCLRCFCLKGLVIAMVTTKVYRYNELRSQLVYKIELLQRASSELVRNESKILNRTWNMISKSCSPVEDLDRKLKLHPKYVTYCPSTVKRLPSGSTGRGPRPGASKRCVPRRTYDENPRSYASIFSLILRTESSCYTTEKNNS
jgi:hypothetical protein